LDETTEVVQPEDVGQGDGGQGGTPYDEYLSRIPEEVRGDVEPVFKDWDKNVTQRFQEASQYRQTWEPYEQAGINQFAPEQVQLGLQFVQALDNPQAIKEWYDQYAQQNGLIDQQAEQQAAPSFDEYGVYGDPSAQQLEQLLKTQLGPIQQQLEAFGQWREAQEFAAREQEALRMIEGQIEELKTKHGDEFNEKAVEQLVAQYIETDPVNAVNRAWADYQALVNQISQSVVKSKVSAPPAAESGGVPDVNPEEIKTLADANRIAKERLRQARMA
jgi:hypothetical protein